MPIENDDSDTSYPVWTASHHTSRYERDAQEQRLRRRQRSAAELEPLLAVMREVDALRQHLEQVGGHMAHLAEMTKLLNRQVTLGDRHFRMTTSLSRPLELRRAVRNVEWDLRFQVRQLHHGLPVYYLARTNQDYFSEYTLIVEDLHLSPGYPMPDPSFVKLMTGMGHEEYMLRLSPFREKLERFGKRKRKEARQNDLDLESVLYRAGRLIFETAWNEDQRLALLIADHLDIPSMRHCLELLYLVLGGDHCEIRGQLDTDLVAFFGTHGVYPQPAIHAFLKQLTRLDGGRLGTLPQEAQPFYSALGTPYSKLLAVEIPREHGEFNVPLYKLLYANTTRLDTVTREIRSVPAARQAIATLDGEARAITERVLALCR